MNLPTGCDVVVVGGGITGACAAAALADRGAGVVLLDKERGPGRECSGRAQGSLRVQDEAMEARRGCSQSETASICPGQQRLISVAPTGFEPPLPP